MSSFQVHQDMRLREILKIYRRVENLHPIATEICASSEFEQMFWNCLTHDLHVIRRRSQNLADGEITPVQKTFRILMEEKADGIAAIEIYMDEILGLKIVPEADRATILAQALQTRDYVLNWSQARLSQSSTIAIPSQSMLSSSSTQYRRSSDSAPDFHDLSDASEGLFASDGSEPSWVGHQANTTVEPSTSFVAEDESGHPRQASTVGGDKREMLRKLFVIYQNAKDEFHSTPIRSLERTKSAKFLRDTTENCIAYIASRGISSSEEGQINITSRLDGGQATLDEMRSTFQEAKKAAEAGSGGKKRRFDENWAYIPEKSAKMRTSYPIDLVSNRDPILRGQISDRKLGKYSVRRRVAQSERIPRGLYPVSAGRGRSRVFPTPIIHHEKRPVGSPSGINKHYPTGHGDCYRPSYR